MTLTNREIYSPVISGCGAYFVHEALSKHIPCYKLHGINPKRGSIPLLQLLNRSPARIIHTQPDLGPHLIRQDQKVVLTFHGFSLDLAGTAQASRAQSLFYRNILEPTIRASLKKADIITAVSAYTANLAANHLGIKRDIVVINNGVDTDSFSPGQRAFSEDIVIFFAGNPTRRKGADYLVSLARALPSGVKLMYTEGVRKRYHLGEHSNLIPVPAVPRSKMPDLYRKADIFLFPSFREGLSLALLEAMASGLPVVATNTSSIPELVEPGKGGFLFDYGDHQQALRQVLRLARDGTLRQEMGAFNRARIMAGYSEQNMVEGYRRIFESL